MSFLNNLKIKAAWHESETSKSVFGILDDKQLEVFSMVDFLEPFNMLQEPLKKTPFLYGTGRKLVTLTDLVKTSYNINHTGFGIIQYQYNDVILDLHYKQSDQILKLSFQYPFIWGPFIRKKPDNFEKILSNPINITATINDDVKLKIGQNIMFNNGMLKQITTQSEFFQISVNIDISLYNITRYLRSINHFLTLCMGTIVFPEEINGLTKNSENFKYFPSWLIRYHQNVDFKNPCINHVPIINFHDIKDNFEFVIQSWIKLWFKTNEIMYDYFNISESVMSISTMFTEYTNVLQRFYDSLNSRETFKNQITWFLNICPEQIKNDICKNNFINKIINTRNYNVHGNDLNIKYVVKDQELVYLINDLKTIIEIFLISQLSIKNTTGIMKKIYDKNNYARSRPIN